MDLAEYIDRNGESLYAALRETFDCAAGNVETLRTCYDFGGVRKTFLVRANQAANQADLEVQLLRAARFLGQRKRRQIEAALAGEIYAENWPLTLIVDQKGLWIKLSECGRMAARSKVVTPWMNIWLPSAESK